MSKTAYFLVLSVSLLSQLAFAAPKRTMAKLTVPDILDASALKDGSDGKPAVDPCNDFYQFSCGQWIEKTDIPADKNRIMHQSTALMDETDSNLNQLILRLEKKDPILQTKASSQIVDYYNSCMSYEKFEGTSLGLLKNQLAEISKIASKGELTSVIAKLQKNGTNAFFGFGSGQDLKDSNSVIGFLAQGGMSLPEPTYYFEKDKKAIETRQKFVEHVARILEMSGEKKSVAQKNAKTILAFETQLASKAYAFDDRQDPSKVNHPITREDLKKLSPAIDWPEFFREFGAPESALNINEPEFFANMSQVIEKSSLEDLKTYLSWQVAHRGSSVIGKDFTKENFNFWNRYLHGEKELKPRWKICTQAIENKLGYALAEVYVKSVDTAAIRAKIEAMITWIKQTFSDDLETLTTGSEAWLDAATKAEAKKKLAKLGQKLGAPEKWRDYSSLTTDASAFFTNDMSILDFENRRDLSKIGKPLDRLEWDMMPWEINAYYDPPKNEFVFPFGILQPPSFDVKASDGANLGAFGGGTIGHELTHGYDNDGRQYDSSGNVKDWWSEQTKTRFNDKTQCFIKQADAYKIKEVGLNVDGKKSLSENLADQGGVKLGYAALLLAQSKHPAGAMWNKYNENQQYWIAYAQSWCGKARSETLRQQIKSNPHPPEEFRVNGVVMNRPEFAKDFNCKAGAPMAPVVRCSIW